MYAAKHKLNYVTFSSQCNAMLTCVTVYML